jgi:hypothetical protein
MADLPQGYEEATRAIAANVSPRYIRLDELERWVACRQYDGRPDWWTGGVNEVPLFERAPCFVYPVAQVAISSNTDLVLGEGRFPVISTKAPGDDAEGALPDESSKALDAFLAEHHKACRFKAHSREAFTAAQSCGTAVGLHGHRNGRPFAELVPAKWATPKLDVERGVVELELRYPYLDEVKVGGKWVVKAKLYRRVITEARDITYLPADAREDGAEPDWVKDSTKSVDHNLGFCPAVWYPFMRGCAPVNQIDGHAIHENLRDEIQQLDLALSYKQRSALNSEPQPVEIGVAPGYNPTAQMGRVAIVPSTERGGTPGLGDPGAVTGAYVVGGSQPARKKGGGFVWSYTDPKTVVEYLSFPPGLLEEQEKHCNDLLGKIEQALAVVLPKPSDFKMTSAPSGAALEQTKSRQYDRCDQYRDDFEDGFIIPSVTMQLRIAERVGAALRVPGIKRALTILQNLVKADAVATP